MDIEKSFTGVKLTGEDAAAFRRQFLADSCKHDWMENPADTDSKEGFTDVICKHCGVCGQRDDRDLSVFWPAT